jgi:hypothetical protein
VLELTGIRVRIEHNKLEFTLQLKVRQDPHIAAQFQALIPPRVAPPRAAPTPVPEPVRVPKSGGMRSFFKPKRATLPPPPRAQPAPPPPPAAAPWRMPDNLARYLRPDGTLARAFVSARAVRAECDMRVAELALPLVGERTERERPVQEIRQGALVVRLFRLPPLPVPPADLPQSLEECERGLRHVQWHKITYFEGTLTQNGGDCTVRPRAQGLPTCSC